MARKRYSAEQIISKLREASVPEDARKLKDFEKENARLKKLVVDGSLDKAMLQKVALGNF